MEKKFINPDTNTDPTNSVLDAIVKCRLKRRGIKLRINELRDHFGTTLRQYGITKEEIDLLQVRIPQEIFIRHYWSPRLSELRDRILQGVSEVPCLIKN